MSYPGKYDLKLWVGNTKRWVFRPKDTDGDPINVSGMRIVFFAGASLDDYLVRFASDDNPDNCTISVDGFSVTVRLSAAQSRLFPKGGTHYELEIRSVDDVEQQTLSYGMILAKIGINDDAH